MRNFINMLNESATPATTPIVEGQLLEEGVRDQIEAVVDRVLGMFSAKHITYEAAADAYDHVVEFTGDPTYFHFTKEQMMVHGKLSKEIATTVVAMSLSLAHLHSMGLPLSAALVAATSALVGAGVVHVSGLRRGMAKKRSDRELVAQDEDRAWEAEKGYPRPGRSPAPAKQMDEGLQQVLTRARKIIQK